MMMKKAIFLTSCLLLLSSCGLTEKLTREHTVRIDTVYRPVSLARHNFSRQFHLSDSLFFEDSRLKLALHRVQPIAPEGDTLHAKKKIGAQKTNVGAELWQLDAQVKPETVRVPVPQKTITDKTERTKYVRRTPGYVKYIIGGLVMLILVIVVAWKVSST